METNSYEFAVSHPQGMTEGEKTKQVRLESSKTDFKLVEQPE